MSWPIAFTDAEISIVMDAARPLDIVSRDAFLVEVTNKLRAAIRAGALGDGLVSRTAREIQGHYLRAVEFREAHGAGKYR